MDVFFETAYAAKSGRLCLFIGTGFSKAVTGNNAPSWKTLLETICDDPVNDAELKTTLFETNTSHLSLDECAQIIDIELAKNGANIHEVVASKIAAIELVGDNSAISEFLENNSVEVVTTNYDKLVEKLAGEDRCHSIAPGFPVPRSQLDVSIYHVHGSFDSPGDMVVTSEDYYKFMNRESYFSKKLATLLNENTVVVLGYSLGDTNLKAVLSDYRQSTRSQQGISNIFFVSRSAVDQCIKNYYAHCFGIRVVDQIEIHDFFRSVLAEIERAQVDVDENRLTATTVLAGTHFYTDTYLQTNASFYEIVAAIAANGRGISNGEVLRVLERVLSKKTELTSVSGAWEQYNQLARWLIYLGSRVDVRNTPIEPSFLSSVLRSMENMSNRLRFGYSWSAYKTWKAGWLHLAPDNRALIKDYITTETSWPDALWIVGLTEGPQVQ